MVPIQRDGHYVVKYSLLQGTCACTRLDICASEKGENVSGLGNSPASRAASDAVNASGVFRKYVAAAAVTPKAP